MNPALAIAIALRASLIIAALGWGISLAAVVLPHDQAFAVLSSMAGEEIAPSPILGYWLRMTGLAFAFIGCLFGYCACAPLRVPGLTRALLAFNLLSGVAFLVVGAAYGLDDHPSAADALFGLSTGCIGLIALGLAERDDRPSPT
ncbi:MAG: hypothetical protein H0W72_11435 [Planctomycetes bacterium]|nr:hypothetical protein [Planctomycetota bacterium]